jgi:hypothetical protein
MTVASGTEWPKAIAFIANHPAACQAEDTNQIRLWLVAIDAFLPTRLIGLRLETSSGLTHLLVANRIDGHLGPKL